MAAMIRDTMQNEVSAPPLPPSLYVPSPSALMAPPPRRGGWGPELNGTLPLRVCPQVCYSAPCISLSRVVWTGHWDGLGRRSSCSWIAGTGGGLP